MSCCAPGRGGTLRDPVELPNLRGSHIATGRPKDFLDGHGARLLTIYMQISWCIFGVRTVQNLQGLHSEMDNRMASRILGEGRRIHSQHTCPVRMSATLPR